ncbi:MAG: GTP cyclohydrolase I FolE [Paramuribaculum sp.]|nr:GTP cyclohydrolase I FolE [Paramuribaculum sp.]
MNYKSEDSQLIGELSHHIEEILKILGENPTREGLLKTPQRAAKALLYVTKGYHENKEEVIGDAIFPTDSKGMVLVKNIEFYSLCEHHLLPFFGHISIGYLPDGKILGLSKLVRIVEMFSRRLQVQEQLTHQICLALSEAIPNRGVVVRVLADHLCMKMRGVEKQNATTLTVEATGLFEKSPEMMQQFLAQL